MDSGERVEDDQPRFDRVDGFVKPLSVKNVIDAQLLIGVDDLDIQVIEGGAEVICDRFDAGAQRLQVVFCAIKQYCAGAVDFEASQGLPEATATAIERAR